MTPEAAFVPFAEVKLVVMPSRDPTLRPFRSYMTTSTSFVTLRFSTSVTQASLGVKKRVLLEHIVPVDANWSKREAGKTRGLIKMQLNVHTFENTECMQTQS